MFGFYSNSTIVYCLAGYVSYNFVIGAYSYWGPKAGYNIYHMVMLFINLQMLILLQLLSLLTFSFFLDASPYHLLEANATFLPVIMVHSG